MKGKKASLSRPLSQNWAPLKEFEKHNHEEHDLSPLPSYSHTSLEYHMTSTARSSPSFSINVRNAALFRPRARTLWGDDMLGMEQAEKEEEEERGGWLEGTVLLLTSSYLASLVVVLSLLMLLLLLLSLAVVAVAGIVARMGWFWRCLGVGSAWVLGGIEAPDLVIM
jgi:hypothetical protein